MLVLSVLFNAYGVFLIKKRLNELGEIRVESLQLIGSYGVAFLNSAGALTGVILFVLAPFLFAVAVSRMEISIAYPVQVGLNFMCIVLLALLFLGEPLTLHKTIGMILVLASIYFFM